MATHDDTRRAESISIRHGPFEMSNEFVEYGVREQQWEARSAPCCGPALERLRGVARALSEAYWWSAASAATFILTDIPPLLPLATRRLRVNLDMPGVARLGLEVDLSYSPREVAELYRPNVISCLPRRGCAP